MDLPDIVPITALPEDVLASALDALGKGDVVVLATVVERHGSAPSTPGQKLALILERRDGGLPPTFRAIGTVGGGAVERAVLFAMRGAVEDAAEKPRITTFRLGPTLGMCCGGSTDILIEPMRPALGVLIVGGGHVGISTAPLLVSLGFRVVLSDAREGVVTEERAGHCGATLVHAEHDDPEVISQLPCPPERAMVLVMTHDHQLDQQVIAWALEKRFAFVGGVGSRAKAARTAQRLAARGVSEADISRIRMPVGLDIGARRPAEIAVAIAAELVRIRAELEGTLKPSRGATPPVAASLPIADTVEVTS